MAHWSHDSVVAANESTRAESQNRAELFKSGIRKQRERGTIRIPNHLSRANVSASPNKTPPLKFLPPPNIAICWGTSLQHINFLGHILRSIHNFLSLVSKNFFPSYDAKQSISSPRIPICLNTSSMMQNPSQIKCSKHTIYTWNAIIKLIILHNLYRLIF